MNSACVFCKIITGIIPSKKVFENDYVLTFHDLHPKSPVHVLIIPKIHVETMDELLDPATCSAMFAATKELKNTVAKGFSGFNILCNNGVAASQSVPHLHWHFVAGKNIYEQDVNIKL
jgi:histidine triad (HIT) family protein